MIHDRYLDLCWSQQRAVEMLSEIMLRRTPTRCDPYTGLAWLDAL